MNIREDGRVMIPGRVANESVNRKEYGEVFDRIIPALMRSDPPADEAAQVLHCSPRVHGALALALAGRAVTLPDPIRDLLAEASYVPVSVDWARIARAGRLFFRTGPVGGLVLGARSLVSGYASPAGNKPLILTGKLQRGTAHRLAETGRFVAEIAKPGGLRPYARGWQIALRVRLMHAEVRRLILETGGWESDRWGYPINQHDMLATALLFSQVWIDGVRLMGLMVSEEEARDWLHAWQWCGQVMGVEPALLPSEEAAATRVVELIRDTQEPPDADARSLTSALLDSGPRPEVARALCHALLSQEMASGLGVVSNRFSPLVRAVQRLFVPLDRALLSVPSVTEHRVSWGKRYWEAAVQHGAQGRPLVFRAVTQLVGGVT